MSKNTNRVSKTEYYLKIARVVLERSSCLRRKYGCIITKNDMVISSGYNGSPRGGINCTDLGLCSKNIHGIDHGVGYEEFCHSVHAEMNAIIHSSRQDMI